MTLQKLKSYMMPIALIIGCIFYKYLCILSFLTPYLIAIMLFVSYCNISWRDIKVTKLHLILLFIQIVGGICVFLVIYPFNHIIAQGSMICILAPTATSAVVITGMLGGNTGSLTSYTIASNTAVAIVAPLLFSWIDANGLHISFWGSLLNISQRIFILLLFPLLLSILLGKYFPRIHRQVQKKQSISFYLWTIALVIATAKTIKFIADQGTENYITEIILGIAALVVCVAQFVIGKYIGTKYNDRIAGGQGLGQKNTILSIWMSQSYLNPISSIAPGTYILWQNIVNSYQIWKKINRGKNNI